MKLGSRIDASGGLVVDVSGEVTESRCGCLGRFIDKRGADAERVTTDLWEVDDLPAVEIAALSTELTRLVGAGRSLVIVGAPQMLAHTLYKTARLDDRLRLVDVRMDEPTSS